MAEFQTARTAGAGVRTAAVDAGLRAHMNRVYGLMSVGMVLTGAVAWAVGTNDTLLSILRDTQTMRPTGIGWAVMFAPLVMVFLFSAMVNRMSAAMAQLVFYAFAAVMGLSISWIFAFFTGMSIAQTFFITAASFAGLSLWGYTTKKDISGWGSFLMMGLIGLIIAMVINIFITSDAMMFAISVIGVLLFAALTAYDTQKIKTEYLQVRTQPGGEAIAEKMAVHGALRLYLDFLNLFMFLLHFFGQQE